MAEAGPLSDFQQARVDLTRAQLAYVTNRGSDAPLLLLKAASRLALIDADLSRAGDPPTGAPGLLRPGRQNYADFINACDRWADCGFLNHDDPPDGDVNFDLQVDRANLDGQPGFWAERWLNDPNAVRAKLDDAAPLARIFPPTPNPVGPDGTTRNMLHCEAIMFGRSADSDHPDGNAPVLLPGWAEDGGTGSCSMAVRASSRPSLEFPVIMLSGERFACQVGGLGLTVPMT